MSPRPPEANLALRAATRARIVEAALELFSSEGYERASMREVARRAGISPGLIYSHFAGKEALLRSVFEEGMVDVGASFAEAEAAPPEARVPALLAAAFRLVRERRRFWRLSYGVRMQAPVLAGLGEALAAWTGAILGTLTRYLAEAGHPEPELEARVLFALIDGISQHYVMEPESYPLAEVEALLAERYGAAAGAAAGARGAERPRRAER